MDAHELKGLQTRQRTLSAEIETLVVDQKSVTARLAIARQELNTINQRIANAGQKEPVVSEHALLRYIERVLGVDLDKVTASILTDKNKAIIGFAGNCKIKSDGLEFIVKNNCVVSVVAD